MSLSKAPEAQESKAVTARGLKVAICSLITEIGTLEQEFKGVKKKLKKLYFEFTLSNGEKVGKIFTYSFHEQSTLLKTLTAWTGSKDFNRDLTVYLGSLVVLNLVENVVNDKSYVNIETFINFHSSEMKEPNFEDVKSYIFDYDDATTYENLIHVPQYIFNKMELTPEYQKYLDNHNLKP